MASDHDRPGRMERLKTVPPGDTRREAIALALIVALGVGARLAFAARFPTLPFWDSLQLIHFASLLRLHGLTAPGWYWAQFNPGLPMILSALFRLFPGDPTTVARTATGIATGLLGAIPFLTWRSVVPFRGRLLAGVLLALWPGQILFSGVVLQDNWVMLPVVALGCLAARRLLGGASASPIAVGLLYAAGVAIRQEMLIVLLPLVLAAAVGGLEARRRLTLLAATVGLCLFALCAQRHAATQRFSLATEHGGLALFGSFMPGASGPGWIDARAYAATLAPEAPGKPFGDQRTLLRLTWEEVRRRPFFHALRIATWLPRVAVNADGDSLLWSVGYPRAQSPDRQPAAQALASAVAPLLNAELAVFHGLFVGSLLLGWKRRDRAILVLSLSILLKFLVHAVVSPLGRLVMPAIALELLVIPLGLALFAQETPRRRIAALSAGCATAAFLLLAVPRLAAIVIRNDPPDNTSGAREDPDRSSTESRAPLANSSA